MGAMGDPVEDDGNVSALLYNVGAMGYVRDGAEAGVVFLIAYSGKANEQEGIILRKKGMTVPWAAVVPLATLPTESAPVAAHGRPRRCERDRGRLKVEHVSLRWSTCAKAAP